MKNRKALWMGLITLLLITVVYIKSNWYYYSIFSQGFGKEYNYHRQEIGQPIIEDYFIKKNKESIQREIWITPDSIRNNYIHISKFINTIHGNLVYEFDAYMNIDGSFKTIIKREYYYNNDSISYNIETEKNAELISKNISKNEGDSILNIWLNNSR